MKAQKDHIYAIIKENKVQEIFKADYMPEWCECGIDNLNVDGREIHQYCIKTVDITDNETVKVGDDYPFKTESKEKLKDKK